MLISLLPNFIAPYKSLKEMIGKVCAGNNLSLKNVVELEQYFGMSHLAMLWRLVSEGYLSKNELEKYSAGVISTVKGLGYDDKLYRPSPVEMQKRTFGYYLKQVERLREKALVSYGKIDELLLDAYRDDIAFGNESEIEGELID